MDNKLEAVCETLDKLTLDSLTLMEQHIQNKIDLEKSMVAGEGNIVKARYIMGQNNVSKLQLPSEDSNEFTATSVVHPSEEHDVIQEDAYDLEIRKKEEGGDNMVNPIRWFGILVPQNLHYAQEKFKQALHWAVKCTNTQIHLQDTLNTIENLKAYKQKLLIKD